MYQNIQPLLIIRMPAPSPFNMPIDCYLSVLLCIELWIVSFTDQGMLVFSRVVGMCCLNEQIIPHFSPMRVGSLSLPPHVAIISSSNTHCTTVPDLYSCTSQACRGNLFRRSSHLFVIIVVDKQGYAQAGARPDRQYWSFISAIWRRQISHHHHSERQV